MLTDKSKQLLQLGLDPLFVKTREGGGGKMLSYVDNHYVITKANEIFNNDWTSETLRLEHIATTEYIDKFNKVKKNVGYRSTVRVTINGIFRDGSGYGDGIDSNEIKAHELALKEAETDARKRALMQFGAPFGLELYDKEHSFKSAAAMRRACDLILKAVEVATDETDLENSWIEHKATLNILREGSDAERKMYAEFVDTFREAKESLRMIERQKENNFNN